MYIVGFHSYAYASGIGIDQAGGQGTIILSPSSGPVGSRVSVTGSLLSGDTSCIITSPSVNLIVGYRCTVLTGGVISGSFTVGTVLAGQYLILAKGIGANPLGDYGEALFTVTSST